MPHANLSNEDYLRSSSMLALADEFDALATGRTQVPSHKVVSRIRDRVVEAGLGAYHDHMVDRCGPLFSHFLASVPNILEEMCRVGVALARLSEERARYDDRHYCFYEIDAFDGTNGRTLADISNGRVRTLTCSPNQANRKYFDKYANSERSFFSAGSFLSLDRNAVGQINGESFLNGFDYIYETAAFQFYGTDRARQIDHALPLLREDGLMFFLEKCEHANSDEYQRRERIKDDFHKAEYFSPEEIEWKRQQMLSRMQKGEVSVTRLVDEIVSRFKYAYLLWNGTNFYEIVASNSRSMMQHFLVLLGRLVVEDQFCLEQNLPLCLGASLD